MKHQNKPLHINAKKEDIADTVIFPGDPLRAKYIAENFLDNAQLVTDVRNMLGYTGTYKGKRITVMGSGMGMPSCGIYTFELIYFYNVQKIIRIGTCGVESPEVKIPEIILADRVYSESNFAYQYDGYKGNIVRPSQELVSKIEETAAAKGLEIHKGALWTTDVFGPYVDEEALVSRVPKKLNVLGQEMESFGLIHIANKYNRQAAVLVTAVDSKYADKAISIEERQTSLNAMIRLALESLI